MVEDSAPRGTWNGESARETAAGQHRSRSDVFGQRRRWRHVVQVRQQKKFRTAPCSTFGRRRGDRVLAQRKLCMHAGRFRIGESSSGLDFGEDISLLGAAGSGGGDAVRLMGCEGSVSLAWKTGEG